MNQKAKSDNLNDCPVDTHNYVQSAALNIYEALQEYERNHEITPDTYVVVKTISDGYDRMDESVEYLYEIMRDTKYKVTENTRITRLHTKLMVLFLAIIVGTQIGIFLTGQGII